MTYYSGDEIEYLETKLKDVIESLSLVKLHIWRIDDKEEREFIRRGLVLATEKIKAITPLTPEKELEKRLLKAVRNGDIEATKEAIKDGANVNATDDFGQTLLHWAAEMGEIYAGKILLEVGLDINARDKDGNTPLHYAVENKRTKTAELLKQHGGVE